MFAPAPGFLVAEPTPHLIPGAIKKTTVLIIIIIFPRGWTITSLPFASAAAIYAARGRIGHAVAARSAAPIGTAAVVIIIVGHVSLLYLLREPPTGAPSSAKTSTLKMVQFGMMALRETSFL